MAAAEEDSIGAEAGRERLRARRGAEIAFSMRVVWLDSVMRRPRAGLDMCFSSFLGERVERVPVVRIFGTTPAGQKACVHLHQCFPYFFVEADENALADGGAELPRRLAVSLNAALVLRRSKGGARGEGRGAEEKRGRGRGRESLGANMDAHMSEAQERGNEGGGVGEEKRQWVAEVRLVHGVPFYGFAGAAQYFLKVSLFDPSAVSDAVTLLRAGAVLGKRFTAFEAHIPFLLQALVDLDVAGMGLLHSARVSFRLPLPSPCEDSPRAPVSPAHGEEGACVEHWTTATVPLHMQSSLSRESHCALEVDLKASDVALCALGAKDSPLSSDSGSLLVRSLEAVWETERQRRRAHGMGEDPTQPKKVTRELWESLEETEAEKKRKELLEKLLELDQKAALEEEQRWQPLGSNSLSASATGGGCDPSQQTAAFGHLYGRNSALPPSRGLETTPAQGSIRERASVEASHEERGSEMRWRKEDRGTGGKYSIASQMAPEFDEELALSQPSDVETYNILNWLGEEAEDDEEDAGEREAEDWLEMESIMQSQMPPREDSTREERRIAKKRRRELRRMRRESLNASTPVVEAPQELQERGKSVENVGDKEKRGVMPLSSRATHSDGKSSGDGDAHRSEKVARTSGERLWQKKEATVKVERDPDAIMEVEDVWQTASRQPYSQELPEPILVESEEEMLQESSSESDVFSESSREQPLDFRQGLKRGREEDRERTTLGIKKRRVEVEESARDKKEREVREEGREEGKERREREQGVGRGKSSQTKKKTGVRTEQERKEEKEELLALSPRLSSPLLLSSPVSSPELPGVEVIDDGQFQQSETRAEEKRGEKGKGPLFYQESQVLPMWNRGEKEAGGNYGARLGGEQDIEIEEDCSPFELSPLLESSPLIPSVPLPAHGGVLDTDIRPPKRKRPSQVAWDGGERAFRWAQPPPTTEELFLALAEEQSPAEVHLEAHYSCAGDVPSRPLLYAGRSLRVPLRDNTTLPQFSPSLFDKSEEVPVSWGPPNALPFIGASGRRFTLRTPPPSLSECLHWLEEREREKTESCLPSGPSAGASAAKVEGPTGYGAPQPPPQAPTGESGVGIMQHLTMISLEVIASTRGELLPDPQYDSVLMVALVVHEEGKEPSPGLVIAAEVREKTDEDLVKNTENIGKRETRREEWASGVSVMWVSDEESLFRRVMDVVKERDADILVGYEVHSSSLGYLAERAVAAGYRWWDLSRLVRKGNAPEQELRANEWAHAHGHGLRFVGRVILNLWRLLKSEVTARSYGIEEIAWQVIETRLPQFSPALLSSWARVGGARALEAATHIAARAAVSVKLIAALDLLQRTSEMARLYGIDFYSVLSRGSQYRVESMVFRLTKPLNFILFSPSRAAVREMKAPECLPLVMEPESELYTCPVAVLDFTSLYPSIVIAYNLCYSTCLGRALPSPTASREFGCGRLHLPSGLLSTLGTEFLHVTPNGVLFAKKEARRGVLPRMLEELLTTRAMVKRAMKQARKEGEEATVRTLDARQMGLKLIANVTYGYTSASFSGRMPCVELADAIVQTARETLERAIRQVEEEFPGARVVYGDTDSLFVALPGATKAQAFAAARRMGARVTAANPAPVELKFEKIYLPSALVSKKRYVGYAFEEESQETATFDAKGIETVRRDGCRAVAKVMEKSLRLLFERRDLSLVKQYLLSQWKVLLAGGGDVEDYVFAKEVRLGSYRPGAPPPPAALVCTKRMARDPRAEPQYGERVAYVVVHGPPAARLMDLVVAPAELAAGAGLRLHGLYYVSKQLIPALARVFSLVGADLRQWFAELPRASRAVLARPPPGEGRRTLDHYYRASRCPACDRSTRAASLCAACEAEPQVAALRLATRGAAAAARLRQLWALCRHCAGCGPPGTLCRSVVCPVFWARHSAEERRQALDALSLS